jgi:hypothetical protein
MLVISLHSEEVEIPLAEISDARYTLFSKPQYRTLSTAITQWMLENLKLTEEEYFDQIDQRLKNRLLGIPNLTVIINSDDQNNYDSDVKNLLENFNSSISTEPKDSWMLLNSPNNPNPKEAEVIETINKIQTLKQKNF